MDAALVPTRDGAKNMTTEILNAIEAYATECAVSFVDDFPGEQLTDSDDWDSAAFEMRHDWDDVDDAFAIFRKRLVAEIARLNLERLQATLTQVQLPELRSTDLRASSRAALMQSMSATAVLRP